MSSICQLRIRAKFAENISFPRSEARPPPLLRARLHDPHAAFVSFAPVADTQLPEPLVVARPRAFAPLHAHLSHLPEKMSAFTISAFAVRPMATGFHHAETRRAERFPKIPKTAPRTVVIACGKKASSDIHAELKEKFTTGGKGGTRDASLDFPTPTYLICRRNCFVGRRR
jgi:hypothetical protein